MQTQKTRLWTYGALLTPREFELFLLDCNGYIQSKAVNINERPQDLVRLVLLLCGAYPEHTGFNPRHQWKDEKRCFTVEGNLYCVEDQDDAKAILFRRPTILGRATHCWKVTDSDGNPLLLKVSWIPTNKSPEATLIAHATSKGAIDIDYLVASEAVDTVAGHRWTVDPRETLNRELWMLVLKRYDGTILEFRSLDQLAYCWRDGAEGDLFYCSTSYSFLIGVLHLDHEKLFIDADILHRDVSYNNILAGAPNSPAGKRGILIDLDLATRFLDRDMTPRLAEERQVNVRTVRPVSSAVSRVLTLSSYHRGHESSSPLSF